ncbi:MAG: GYF domain-containing protein, partial [Planctomycetia bacterium]
GGAPSPPCDAATMRAWLDAGSATADHVVWRQDWPEWRPLLEVFPEARVAAPGDRP